jgi:hypothetical protein
VIGWLAQLTSLRLALGVTVALALAIAIMAHAVQPGARPAQPRGARRANLRSAADVCSP